MVEKLFSYESKDCVAGIFYYITLKQRIHSYKTGSKFASAVVNLGTGHISFYEHLGDVFPIAVFRVGSYCVINLRIEKKQLLRFLIQPYIIELRWYKPLENKRQWNEFS